MPKLIPHHDIIVWDQHPIDPLDPQQRYYGWTIEYGHPSMPSWSYRIWFFHPEGADQ